MYSIEEKVHQVIC